MSDSNNLSKAASACKTVGEIEKGISLPKNNDKILQAINIYLRRLDKDSKYSRLNEEELIVLFLRNRNFQNEVITCGLSEIPNISNASVWTEYINRKVSNTLEESNSIYRRIGDEDKEGINKILVLLNREEDVSQISLTDLLIFLKLNFHLLDNYTIISSLSEAKSVILLFDSIIYGEQDLTKEQFKDLPTQFKDALLARYLKNVNKDKNKIWAGKVLKYFTESGYSEQVLEIIKKIEDKDEDINDYCLDLREPSNDGYSRINNYGMALREPSNDGYSRINNYGMALYGLAINGYSEEVMKIIEGLAAMGDSIDNYGMALYGLTINGHSERALKMIQKPVSTNNSIHLWAHGRSISEKEPLRKEEKSRDKNINNGYLLVLGKLAKNLSTEEVLEIIEEKKNNRRRSIDSYLIFLRKLVKNGREKEILEMAQKLESKAEYVANYGILLGILAEKGYKERILEIVQRLENKAENVYNYGFAIGKLAENGYTKEILEMVQKLESKAEYIDNYGFTLAKLANNGYSKEVWIIVQKLEPKAEAVIGYSIALESVSHESPKEALIIAEKLKENAEKNS